MSDTPSLAFVIKQAIEDRLGNMHTILPAKVVKVDVTKAKCDVQVVLKKKYADGELVDLPVITDVPIGFYRANDAFISLPVKVGDYVELKFSERSLDIWLNKGGTVDPADPRKFHLADAIAYPGLYPFTDPPIGATADDVVIKNKASKVTLKPSGEIQLEGSAIKALAELVILSGTGDAVALASKVMTELSAIRAAFNSHTHPYTDDGNPATTAPSPVQIPAAGSVASTKVLAQ